MISNGNAQELNDKALSGRRILVTRSKTQASGFQRALIALGAEAIVVPLIEIIPPDSYEALDQAISRLEETDFLILTSANAVSSFFDRLNTLNVNPEILDGLTKVAVGPKTAASMAKRGVQADLTPADFRAEGIVSVLENRVKNKLVLYPKAALARDVIPLSLKQAGARVLDPVAYASAPPPEAAVLLSQALDQGLDLLTFTASSAVKNFTNLLSGQQRIQAKKIPVASIGPLTSETAKKLGFQVVIEPQNSTLNDMIESIKLYFKRQ